MSGFPRARRRPTRRGAAPVITQHPANATVPSESPAAFSVVATGSPSPTYQWQRQAPNGGGFFNITRATSASYTTPSVYYYDDENATESGAQYRVVVTNSQGSVTSNVATLTVTPTAITGFTQISAGFRHVLALRSDGTVWAWGSNGYGQVGRTCTDCSPRPVNGLTGTFTQVLARGDASFAVRNDGKPASSPIIVIWITMLGNTSVPCIDEVRLEPVETSDWILLVAT